MTDYIQLDYYDFKINIKAGVSNNRPLSNEIQAIQRKYARKENMAEKGLLSDSAAKSLGRDKTEEIAKAYAKHVIVGWEGKYNGKKLPEYSVQACTDLLSDPENDALLADIIDQSIEAQNNHGEQEKVEAKNSKASSSGS